MRQQKKIPHYKRKERGNRKKKTSNRFTQDTTQKRSENIHSNRNGHKDKHSENIHIQKKGRKIDIENIHN